MNQTADRAAPIPDELQDVLPTRVGSAFPAQSCLDASWEWEQLSAANIQMPAARKGSD